jgi:hypothetical protein
MIRWLVLLLAIGMPVQGLADSCPRYLDVEIHLLRKAQEPFEVVRGTLNFQHDLPSASDLAHATSEQIYAGRSVSVVAQFDGAKLVSGGKEVAFAKPVELRSHCILSNRCPYFNSGAEVVAILTLNDAGELSVKGVFCSARIHFRGLDERWKRAKECLSKSSCEPGWL